MGWREGENKESGWEFMRPSHRTKAQAEACCAEASVGFRLSKLHLNSESAKSDIKMKYSQISLLRIRRLTSNLSASTSFSECKWR